MMIRKCVALTLRFGIVLLMLITSVKNMIENEKCYTHCGRLPGQIWLFFNDDETVISDLHFFNSPLNSIYVMYQEF
jgi:hypothetical protein